MNEDRSMVVNFMDGTRLDIAFPVQIRNSPAAVLEAMKRLMEADKFAVEAEGKLIVIPWSGIRTLEVTPLPASLPFGTIKGAKTIESPAPHSTL